MRALSSLVTFALLAALASCAGPERIAQRKLRKAIRLDPTIIQKQYTDTLIKGYVDYIHDIQVAAQHAQTDAFKCDSIYLQLERAQADMIARGDTGRAVVYLYRDSSASIYARKETGGRMSVAYDIKPKVIHDTARVPYAVQVRVPGKLITQRTTAPATRYLWFWLLIAYASLVSYLFVRELINNRKSITKAL